MCKPKSPPRPEAPAPAPPPPSPAASVAQADAAPASGETADDIASRVRRRGRNSLRIDAMGQSDSTGLNIPVS